MKYLLFCTVLAVSACGDDDQLLTREQLLDPANCESCHPKAFAEWQSSMHAYAADDPVFLAMNARGQRETNGELGDFCVKCHAPMAVREGLTTDGLNLDELPQHMKSVTCYFCHSVDAVEGTHDNPLRLADDGVMRGGVRDPLENGVHEMAYSPLLDRDAKESSQLCGACHDIVTPRGVHLERTYLEWQESVFPDEPFSLSCGACHMNGSQDIIADFEGVGIRRRHDHSFPGLDVAIIDWPGKEAQLAGIEKELETTVQAELCYNPDGNVVTLDLTNIGAGHMWPSGSAQDRRAWVELKVESGDQVVIDTGDIAEGVPVASVDDPLLWQFRDYAYDEDGAIAHMFWDVATVESELLPPAKEVGMPHNVLREYPLGASPAPTRMTAKLHVRPIGLDVLDDLIDSGDLDPMYRDSMPTLTLSGTQTEWTPELAGSDLCVTSRVP